VLVVDDQEPVRALASTVLRHYVGATIAEAADGAEALQCMDEATPALVLTDLMMPGIDGLALVRRLRADPTWRAIPVVAMSGGPSKAEALAAGCDAFLSKPFLARELADVVVRLLRRERERGARPA
jgi:CheY-like chemotaxis protein